MLEDFVQDRPRSIARPEAIDDGGTIAGVRIDRLAPNADERGALVELLTTRDEAVEPIVHIYQVLAAAGSRRGWVYHKWQTDRLAFTLGAFQIDLVDIRRDSPTFGARMRIEAGEARPCRVFIPPLVAHSVSNLGAASAFVNMPTRAYDPANPDKFRFDGDIDAFGPA